MNKSASQTKQPAAKPLSPTQGILQRKCACGNHTVAGGECTECGKKKMQRKLTIGSSNDPLELEADRVANQVMATPAHRAVSGAPPYIQRFSGQPTGQMDAVPTSVDHALATSGRPLDPVVRQDMEQRFGHDFSQVRVHSGSNAEQSARDVSANAYTVGRDIVFGAGWFAPGTNESRRLLAHELTHVVQQAGGDVIPSSLLQRQPTPALIRKGKILSLQEISADPVREKARKNTGQTVAKVCRSISAGASKENCPATLEPGLQVTIIAEKAGGLWLQVVTPELIPGFGPKEPLYVMAAFVEELPAGRTPAGRAPATSNFLTSDLAQQLSDEEIDRHIQGVIDRERAVAKGSPEAKTLADNLAVLEGEVKRRGSTSPVLVRAALILGSAEVVTRTAADLALNNDLFKATSHLRAGVFHIFKDHFLGEAEKHRNWIDPAARAAGGYAQNAPITDRPAAFAAIAQATPMFLAAWGGERLLEVWVSFLKMGDEILRNVPGFSVEYLLVWLGKRRDEISSSMVRLSSLDPAKVQATLEAMPLLFEKLDKEQKDLVTLIKEGQENLRKILIATTIIELVTSVTSLRGVFTFPRIPPTPPTGLVPVAVGPGGVAIVGLALKPIEWAEVMRRFLQAGLVTLPVTSAALKGSLVLIVSGGTPGGGGVPKPGTPSAATAGSGSGGYTAPPKPKVSGGARPETAGSGGIASIDRTYDKSTGVSQTIIEGRLQPTLPQRAGLEKLLGPDRPNADKAHLWGRIFGDEAAAGTLYAPSNFNRGVQLTMEKMLTELQQEAKAAGGYVWLRASNRSHPKKVWDGKALAEVKYEFQIRLPDGRIRKITRVEFNDIVVPGTAVTKRRPGFTISAPFEGSVTQ